MIFANHARGVVYRTLTQLPGRRNPKALSVPYRSRAWGTALSDGMASFFTVGVTVCHRKFLHTVLPNTSPYTIGLQAGDVGSLDHGPSITKWFVWQPGETGIPFQLSLGAYINMELMQALYHWARLGYYTTALDHVGHHHSDSAYITLCCIESQAVLERFLAGQQLTLDQEVRNQLHMNGRLAHLLILMSSWLTVISAIVILMWQR